MIKKLGIKAGFRIFIYDPPSDYFDLLAPMPDNFDVVEKLSGKVDLIHIFVKNEKAFHSLFRKVKRFVKGDGMLWVSWPKKSSGVFTDVDENKIRNFGLSEGLVDVKVCAIDEMWSALKFVIPVKDRMLSG